MPGSFIYIYKLFLQTFALRSLRIRGNDERKKKHRTEPNNFNCWKNETKWLDCVLLSMCRIASSDTVIQIIHNKSKRKEIN